MRARLLLFAAAAALCAGRGFAQPVGADSASSPPAQAAVADDPALYQPQDKDERGLWMEMDEAERRLKTSPAVIHDPALNAYVREVLCRTAGQAQCRNIRVYIIRTARFNAAMSPNGVLEVWSGLLLRMQNEAQLAAVLGHEYTHFEKRHSLLLFRQAKSKSNAAVWLSFTGIGLIASIGLESSLYKFSRDMESEADRGGLAEMAAAGYDTREAAKVWERLREEMDATAAERNTKSRKDKNGGMFATHPPTLERVEGLTRAAAENPGVPGETGQDRFRAALAHVWPEFVDDQIKLNDFGASDFLLTSLGQDGWTPELLYARGELYRHKATGEALNQAVGFFGQAIAEGGQIAELWRGRGLARLKLGQEQEGQADLREYLARAPASGDHAMIAMLAGEE
jgi:hypothetical protein